MVIVEVKVQGTIILKEQNLLNETSIFKWTIGKKLYFASLPKNFLFFHSMPTSFLLPYPLAFACTIP